MRCRFATVSTTPPNRHGCRGLFYGTTVLYGPGAWGVTDVSEVGCRSLHPLLPGGSQDGTLKPRERPAARTPPSPNLMGLGQRKAACKNIPPLCEGTAGGHSHFPTGGGSCVALLPMVLGWGGKLHLGVSHQHRSQQNREWHTGAARIPNGIICDDKLPRGRFQLGDDSVSALPTVSTLLP